MAIVPQRRIGKTRKRKRRSHFKLDLPGIMVCPNCGETKLAHTVCRSCGFYDGKQVLTIKAKEAEEQAVEEKPVKKTRKVKTEETAEVKPTKKAVKKVIVDEAPVKAVRKTTKKPQQAE